MKINTNEEIGELRELLKELCEGYDKGLNFEYQADYFMSEVGKALQDRDVKIINLRADIAYAIGHGQGSGNNITYLEKRYPDLAGKLSKKNGKQT